MPTGMLGSGSRSAQFWQASGESTPSATLPERYVSNPAATSPISGHMDTPTDWMSQLPGRDAAVVRRWPRMVGMRYLYARGMTPMPIKAIGADGIPRPWVSRAQPNNQGPIRNAGFNDKLFQAGYPGFNLGLSFKVPTVARNSANQPGYNMHMTGPQSVKFVSTAVNRLRRPSGAPKERG
jgi:hypothetical protein